jgi:hypothetical protein
VARLALEKPAAACLADKTPVTHRHLTPHSHDMGPAFNRHAFKWIVIYMTA